MKKILCTLMIVVMCLTSVPVGGLVGLNLSGFDFGATEVSALSESGQCGDNVYWSFDSNTGELTISGTGDMWDFYSGSLSYFNGVVDDDGDSPFKSMNVKSVVIVDGITNIGDHTFNSCSSISSIVISNSVTNIGASAFFGCSSLTSIIIGNSVTSIGEYAFQNCNSLNSVTIPDSVTIIGNCAFWYCTGLTSVTIPDSVTSIGNYAFYGCSSLTGITIPDSVTSIGEEAFCNCSSIISITVDIDNAKYSNDSYGALFNKDKTELIQYPAGNKKTSYSISNTVTKIGIDAFINCQNLNSISIPDSVTSMGWGAFYGCNSLTSIIIPGSVKNIGMSTFDFCSSLTSVTIQYGVTSIDWGAFKSCTNLNRITIPNSVTSIGERAFDNCSSLKDVYYSGTQAQWNQISIGYYNDDLLNATIHFGHSGTNSQPSQSSYFVITSDENSVDSLNRYNVGVYKIQLLDKNSSPISINNVTAKNNTPDIIKISTKKLSDTVLELTVDPKKDGDASISIINGADGVEQFFNFSVYSDTNTYRADKVPVTNEKLKTNFSRGDLTVDNFSYVFDENKDKYIAKMDVYNSSGAIGTVTAYTQDGKISDIEKVDPYVPLPGDFGEFLVYLGAGSVSYLKGDSFNYRYALETKKTKVEIEVPKDGYLTVSCDITVDKGAFIYNLVSIGVDLAFKTAEVVQVLGTDTDEIAEETTKKLAKDVAKHFGKDDKKDNNKWLEGAMKKVAKKLSKKFSVNYIGEAGTFSVELLNEMYQNIGKNFIDALAGAVFDIAKVQIEKFGVEKATKKLIENKVIAAAEEALLKAASVVFDAGGYIKSC